MLLTDKIAEQHAELACIKASEVELTEGPDAALLALGSLTDAVRLRAALGILFRSKRYQQAADLIRHLSAHEKWIDLGAAIFATIGDIERAQRLLSQSDEYADRLTRLRTRLGFAEGIIENLLIDHENTSLLSLRAWSVSEIEKCKQAIEVIDPLLLIVQANQQIKNDLELYAIQYAVYFAHICDDRPLFSRAVGWLKKYTPIPLLIAELSLRRMTECPVNLASRLRSEFPDDFQASLLASLVERELLDRPEDSFDALVQLETKASSDEERKTLSSVLFETCGYCRFDRIDQAIGIIKKLIPNESLILVLLEVFKKVAEEDLVNARLQLDSVRDESSSVWWQTHAQLLEKTGHGTEAEDAWQKASELLPHPEVLRRSVQASLDQHRFGRAIRGAQKLLDENPNSIPDLRVIAHALIQTGNYLSAAGYLERLVSLQPTRLDYRMSLAQCLGRSTQTKKAITVLEPLCTANGANFEALMMQSEFLTADGRPKDAFKLLQMISKEHWHEPIFLLHFLDCAYRAEEDEHAHDIFARLMELRHAGKVPHNLLQSKTLEELLEHGQQFREIRENLQQAVVAGRLPWLSAEDRIRNPPAWAWALHTQELKWNSEDPISRASTSIYSTNGFTVCTTEEGKQLRAIQASARGMEIVVDLSALLTLHALNKLDNIADFFKALILPASYGDLHVRDGSRFGQHQPSRETELQCIRAQVEAKQIHIIDALSPDLFRVDEYSDTAELQVYRLKDLIQPLEKTQSISTEVIKKFREIAQNESLVSNPLPLDIGTRLLIDMGTLRTIASQPIFETVLKTFSVHLKSSQWEEVLDELQAHQYAHIALNNHTALWNNVNKLLGTHKIRYEPLPKTSNLSEDPEANDDVPFIHLDSVELASSLGKSLLVDDRVLQVLMFQEYPDSVSRAFDTSKALQAMYEEGVSALSDVADSIQHLLHWRYRFIVPIPQMLFEWALESIDNLPGDTLLDVAAYLHDCLRDPGIHCGLEQSEPPLPMAARFVTAWSEMIASFLALIWSDSKFSDENASKLTQWVVEDLVPSCPRGMAYFPMGINIAQAEKESLLRMAIVKFTTVPERRRANLGLRILANTFGMNESEFLTTTAEAIHVITGA